MTTRSGRDAAPLSGSAISAGGRSPAASVMRVKRFSSLLLKRRVTCCGERSSTASATGEDSSTIAGDEAGDTDSSTSQTASSEAAREAGREERVTGRSAPVVQHQVAGVFVVLLLAPLHPHHREVDVVAALEQRVVGGPVVGVGGHHPPLQLARRGHLLHALEQGLLVLGLALAAVDGQELHVGAAVRRLAVGRQVADREPDDLAALLEQERVAEGEPVDDLDLLGEIEPAPEAVGDAADLLHHLLLARLLERRVAAHRHARLERGPRRRRGGVGAVDRLAGCDQEPLRLVAELLVHDEMLGAVGVGREALQGGLVLVEELLARGEELLPDVLVLVVGQDRDRADDPDRPPHDRDGGAHDLAVAPLGHEPAPRLHEPAVVHVLGAAEDLSRPGAHLPLEEVAEGLLDDVAHLGEIALADAADLDERRAALRVEAGTIDGRPHDFSGTPASSSSSVITPEWSSPPLPFTRMALNSSWTTAVHGSGTPRAREDSMISPRSLKCRSILKPGL